MTQPRIISNRYLIVPRRGGVDRYDLTLWERMNWRLFHVMPKFYREALRALDATGGEDGAT